MLAITPIDPAANKAEKYELLIKQAEAIISSESDLIANMAHKQLEQLGKILNLEIWEMQQDLVFIQGRISVP